MKYVKCTRGKLYELTIGKVYKVYSEGTRDNIRVYEIVNDEGIKRSYAARKFAEVQGEIIDSETNLEVLKLD